MLFVDDVDDDDDDDDRAMMMLVRIGQQQYTKLNEI